MNRVKQVVYYLLLIGCISTIVAQEASWVSDSNRPRLSAQLGLIKSGMIDEYISLNRYSGNFPYATISWSDYWSKGLIEANFSHGNTETLSNESVDAWFEFTDFDITLFYELQKSQLSRKTRLFVGPSLQFSSYYLSHTFASLARYESEGSILSLGAGISFFRPINSVIDLETKLSCGLLSTVRKDFDYRQYTEYEGNSALSSIFQGGSIKMGIGARVHLSKSFSMLSSYGLVINRIGTWDKYKEVQDRFSLEVSYGF